MATFWTPFWKKLGYFIFHNLVTLFLVRSFACFKSPEKLKMIYGEFPTNALTRFRTRSCDQENYIWAAILCGVNMNGTNTPRRPVWPDLVKFHCFGKILDVYCNLFEGSFSIWQHCEPFCPHFLCLCANFQWCK